MGSTVTGPASVAAKRGTMIAAAQSRQGAAGGVISAIQLDSSAFMASLIAALGRMEVESEDALVAVGLQIESTARGLAPVDTGRLRSSIIMTKGRDGTGFFVQIGTNVSYAAYVEFGTRYMRPQPFLLPAVALGSGYWRQVAA